MALVRRTAALLGRLEESARAKMSEEKAEYARVCSAAMRKLGTEVRTGMGWTRLGQVGLGWTGLGCLVVMYYAFCVSTPVFCCFCLFSVFFCVE